MKSKPRTVLRIRDGEFVSALYSDRVETCNHIKDALDVSGLHISTLQSVLDNLYKIGCKDMKVMVVKNG